MHNRISLSVLLTLLCVVGYAQKFCSHYKLQNQSATTNTIDPRSAYFDVQSYTIDAAFLNYQIAKKIEAKTSIKIVLLKKIDSMSLDLLNLAVSSVKVNQNIETFSYDNRLLTIPTTNIMVGDTFDVVVSYAGNPQKDLQWGGFYFTGEYAFNLGVGFASDPHNFGRVWFPCFDNFTDRAEYYTNITVDSGYKAYANGYLTQVVDNSNKTQTYRWTMDEPIPTYLASVAIAAYEEIKMNVSGIPVSLTSLAADTNDLKSSFENLPACIDRFVETYGAHSFDRIGFNIVPFNSGAMEHATNIAYPRYAIENGSKSNETLFAHELAHHWWGNTITCSTQEDMWLNEGWASYSERIFLEKVYGREKYNEDIEANHRNVLQFAHVRDGTVLPVSGIGFANTYGSHVYNKGADMVHTLRGMMGDDAFFTACSSFQTTYKFQDVSTEDMKKHFQLFTPLNLSSFFDQWIKEGGFAHFDILWTLKQDGKYKVHLKQTPRFNNITYTNVIARLTAFSANFERFDSEIIMQNKEQTFDVNCPFEPVFWVFDFDDKISDATTTDAAILHPGDSTFSMSQGMMQNIHVTNNSIDSMLLRIEHHWAPVDGTFGAPAGVQLSKERFWNVGGIWDEDVSISAEIIYSGLKSNSAIYGYLDSKLIRITEDSLVLLYRPNASTQWKVAQDYVKNAGSLYDKRGTIEIKNLQKGQYCLAMYDSKLASTRKIRPKAQIKLYPNPAEDHLQIEFENIQNCCKLEITNSIGQVVLTKKIRGYTKTKKLDISALPTGTYFIGIVTDNIAYDIKHFLKK